MADRNVVVLVGPDGTVCGTAENREAHEPPGILHLAFSVVLVRGDGKCLLQQRASTKYHFPMLWANSCCSHPAPSSVILESAKERVGEELGIACELKEVGSFIYRAVCPSSGLVEHELDHVFVGTITEEPSPDPSEVAAVMWASPQEVSDISQKGLTVPWLEETLRLVAARSIDP